MKFILVQLPELIDPKSNKTAYDFVQHELKVETPTIFDITKERLIRASKKIQEENKDKDLSNQDLGFKVFETTPIWEDYNFESVELEKQTSLFDESKLTQEDLKALLVTCAAVKRPPLASIKSLIITVVGTNSSLAFNADPSAGLYLSAPVLVLSRIAIFSYLGFT